jgi:hypothetical protein
MGPQGMKVLVCESITHILVKIQHTLREALCSNPLLPALGLACSPTPNCLEL